MPHTKQAYTNSIREALRIINVNPDDIESDEGDVIEIGRNWLIEFNPLTITLQQVIDIPATRWDPPDADYKDIASIRRDATPDQVAEFLVTHIAHILIQEQLMAYGEAQFEEEMRANAKYPDEEFNQHDWNQGEAR